MFRRIYTLLYISIIITTMTTKILILIITAFIIAWGLCRSKQMDEINIRKTDRWFLISSLIICVAMTCLGWVMHLGANLWFLLLPAISISLMCIYTGRTVKQEPDNAFTIIEKWILVLLVIFLCSGLVDKLDYMSGIRRLTNFYMASMFYKMLGGWILAELVFCRKFPVALVKAFFLIVFAVNVVRLIDVLWFHSIYRDGTYPMIQIAISLVVLIYMYCRYPSDKKLRNKIVRS